MTWDWNEKFEENRKIARIKRNAHYSKNKKRYQAKRREKYWKNVEHYRAKRREYDLKNRERLSARDRKWRETNLVHYIFDKCKKRAEKAGLLFSLTLQWVEKRIIAGICERTGHSFICKIGCADDRNPWFPSIDRIDSSLGYTKNNCQMVCLIYNLAKNKWTDATMLEMAKSIVGYHEKDPLA